MGESDFTILEKIIMQIVSSLQMVKPIGHIQFKYL